MILVLGSITAKPDTFETLRKLAVEHVERSRTEPGCISHDVHIDNANAMKLVFIEKWKDAAALGTHFKVKASIDFVNTARQMGAAAPTIEIYEAAPARIG